MQLKLNEPFYSSCQEHMIFGSYKRTIIYHSGFSTFWFSPFMVLIWFVGSAIPTIR